MCSVLELQASACCWYNGFARLLENTTFFQKSKVKCSEMLQIQSTHAYSFECCLRLPCSCELQLAHCHSNELQSNLNVLMLRST